MTDGGPHAAPECRSLRWIRPGPSPSHPPSAGSKKFIHVSAERERGGVLEQKKNLELRQEQHQPAIGGSQQQVTTRRETKRDRGQWHPISATTSVTDAADQD